ncbi:hypothetical protein EV641_1115 [Rhodococcus sp. SMB37]|nr:hypothetical protein EV641_1115 [Rhodococcus sp. SMB37]
MIMISLPMHSLPCQTDKAWPVDEISTLRGASTDGCGRRGRGRRIQLGRASGCSCTKFRYALDGVGPRWP